MKAGNEEKSSCINLASGDKLNYVRVDTHRPLNSLFGQVTVTRIGYSQINKTSIFPVYAELNLSTSSYSDGLYFKVSNEAIRGSFDNVVESIDATTGDHVPKRQCLNIVKDVAVDFESFYRKKRFIKPEDIFDLLVLTFDGNGVVMRPDGLRECTKKNAQKSKKLKSRLNQGEKKDRKRMAQVAAVYTVQPHIRSAESVMKVSEYDTFVPFRTPV